MKYRINESSNIYDLKTVISEHYEMELNELDELNTIELSNPKTVTNIEKCLDILRDIKRNNQKILIVGDYDCDGICATTILATAFEKCKLNYGFYIPNRLTEGYGLNVDILKKAIEKGYQNIITVDNGVKAFEAMQFAKENNLRLIITDHHTFDINDIDCDCFIHPFLNDDMFYNCSGAGIALQIARCMIPSDKDIVCYAALAAIADCMPVTRENRNIIRKGIEYLNEGCAAPLHALKNKPQDKFDIKMMSYTIIPKINSMGRLCDVVNVNNAVRYLMLSNSNAIYNAAAQINKINDLRKEKTSEMEKVAILENKPFEILTSPDYHEGIVGLLASKLSNTYKKPFIVLSENKDNYKGSIRGVDGFHLIDYFKDFNGFEKFGGHAQAAGVTLSKDKLFDLKEYVDTHVVEIEESNQIVECEHIDEQALNLKDVQDYLNLAPFGIGFEEINYYIGNINIQSKISLANGKYYKVISNHDIEYLFFKSDLFDQIKENMNVVGKLSISEFRGTKKINMIVDAILEDEDYV